MADTGVPGATAAAGVAGVVPPAGGAVAPPAVRDHMDVYLGRRSLESVLRPGTREHFIRAGFSGLIDLVNTGLARTLPMKLVSK